jgi:hypothetical protein
LPIVLPINVKIAQLVQQRSHQVVFLGDGAAWIWLMAALLLLNRAFFVHPYQ